MSKMFYKCSSLLSLPDISKWNTNNVNQMTDMLSSCSRLSSLPDISKWKLIELVIWVICLIVVQNYHLYLIFQNEILIMQEILTFYLIIVQNYHLYLIFQNGILIMLQILAFYLIFVHHYHLYLIFQNGILMNFMKNLVCLKDVQSLYRYLNFKYIRNLYIIK